MPLVLPVLRRGRFALVATALWALGTGLAAESEAKSRGRAVPGETPAPAPPGPAATPTPPAPAPAPATPAKAPAAPDPDAPTVTTRVDRTQVYVGDPIVVTITAVTARGIPVNLPSAPDLEPFSLLDRKDSEQDLGDGKVRRTFVLTVAAYDTGEVTFPSIAVTYLGAGGEVRTRDTLGTPIKVASLLANESEPTLKEDAAPVSVLEDNMLLVYGALAVAVAALGGLITVVGLRRLRARAARRPGPPPRPAHAVALEKLDRLGAAGFAADADHRPFTFAVSEVVREYLGERYGFDSLELTTDELMAELVRHAGRDLVLGEAEGWLATCDLVKFARVSPTAAEARATLEDAIRMVEATRPRPEPMGPVVRGPPAQTEARP